MLVLLRTPQHALVVEKPRRSVPGVKGWSVWGGPGGPGGPHASSCDGPRKFGAAGLATPLLKALTVAGAGASQINMRRRPRMANVKIAEPTSSSENASRSITRVGLTL